MPVFGPGRSDPAYDAVNLLSTTAGSNYNGATMTLNRQFQDDFEVLAGYTYSKSIDDASSDLEQPQNPFDPLAERSLSLLDQRHRFTLSGLWLIGPGRSGRCREECQPWATDARPERLGVCTDP